MGSLRFGGVVFQAFSFDHPPAHVHGRYAGIEVIVEIDRRIVTIASRRDAINPRNAKRSDVAFIVRAANLNLKELIRLWEETHDQSRAADPSH